MSALTPGNISGGSTKPHVVVVGAGFGGLAAAHALRHAPVDVTIVDRQNHHLFQPLLYQVATAGLSPADIASPIRSIVKRYRNTRVLLDCVEGVNRADGTVSLRERGTLHYDWLILATGSQHSYFGRDEWAVFAPGLKTIDDATMIRRNVLLALERAEGEQDDKRRDALLTFVIIGGGPTGVEMAGAIAELSRTAVSMEFRHITPRCSRIILIDAGDRLLKSFPEKLSAKAKASLEMLGVEIRLNVRIDALHDRGVMIGEELVSAHTIVWAAGVVASPAASWLGCKSDRAGRAEVGPDLRPDGGGRIFVIGDTASCAGAAGAPMPGIATVAKQQGQHAARQIVRAIQGRAPRPFRYRSYGSMATIGRKRAVADFGRLQLSGLPAWLLWSTVHVYFLVGFRSRLSVGFTWMWNYLTFQRQARLITGLGNASPLPGQQRREKRLAATSAADQIASTTPAM